MCIAFCRKSKLKISGITSARDSWMNFLSREKRKGEGQEYKTNISIQRTTVLIKYTLHNKYSDPLRLIRKQERQVSKVLLDGLYDPDSPISKLLGVHTEVMGEIIWQKLVENWQIFPGQ